MTIALHGGSEMKMNPPALSSRIRQRAIRVTPQICVLIPGRSPHQTQDRPFLKLKHLLGADTLQSFSSGVPLGKMCRIFGTSKHPGARGWFQHDDEVEWNDVLSPESMVRRQLPGPFFVYCVTNVAGEYQRAFSDVHGDDSPGLICQVFDTPVPRQRELILEDANRRVLIAPPGFFQFCHFGPE